MSKFSETFTKCNKEKMEEVVAASKTSSGIPVGTYAARLVGGEPDTYEDDDGDTCGKAVVSFEIVTSSDDPKLVGTIQKEFWRFGQVFEDGGSPDASTAKKMFKTAFNEDMREDVEGFAEDLDRLFTDALGSVWKLTRKASKDGKYVNTKIGGIVNV